jgi:DNA-binding NarL/FixJ family response regulator
LSDARLRVLLVDDTTEYRTMLRIILQQQGGFEIVGEAANGAEAVELTRALRPDVVVLDLAMPVMDGLEALPLLRDVSPETAVVVLSGFARGQLDHVALARGAAAYVEKGEAFSRIAETLLEVVARAEAV